MKLIKYIVVIVILYLFFHNPIFTFLGGIGSIKIVDVVSIFFLLLYGKSIFRRLSFFRREFVILFLIFFFVIFRSVLGGDSAYIRSTLVAIVEIMIVPTTIVYVVGNKLSFSEKDFIRTVLLVGSVGALISCLCIINPSFGNFIKYQLQILGDSIEEMSWRGFGVSEALTSSYGYIQGLILVFGTIYIKDNKWFILAYPFIFASTILNARTGVIIAIVGLIIFAFTNRNRKIIKSLFVGVAVFFVFYVILQFVQKSFDIDEGVLKYAQTLFDELSEMESEGSVRGSSTLDVMIEQMIVMPETFEDWVIGRGYSIMGTGTRITSDIGFIIQLNYGGIIYLSLLMYLILVIIMKMKKNCFEPTFVLIFIMTFAICNFKGDMLLNSGIFRFMMLFYLYRVLKNAKLEFCKYK